MFSKIQDAPSPPNPWGDMAQSAEAFHQTRGLWEVDASWTADNADDLVIVDVRQPAEFNDALGHIPDAELLPLGELAAAAPERFDRDSPVVVVCRSGARSLQGASVLTQLGFTKVASMAGGMAAWNRLGFTVERG